MTIVGFNYTKISIERKPGTAQGRVNINNNVSIKAIEKTDIAFGPETQGDLKFSGLRFSFEFVSKYDPDIGEINLGGDVLYMDDEKKVKEILNEWKKEKKVSKELMTNIVNAILMKCNIQALILSQELNLPAPIPLPRVDQQTQVVAEDKNYIG